MNYRKVLPPVLGLVLVFVPLVSCGAPPAAATAAPTSAPTAAANFPTGKFVEADNDQAGFEFNADGTWSAFNGIYTIGRGTYSVKGDLYTEETNNQNCGTSPMSFQYSFDGTNLKFNLTGASMNDDCDGRKLAFDGKTYVLSK